MTHRYDDRGKVGCAERRYFDQQAKCFYCNGLMSLRKEQSGPLLPPPGPPGYTIDHFVPVSKGGPDSWYNKVLAHKTCNHEKGDRLPTTEEWLKFEALDGDKSGLRKQTGIVIPDLGD